MDHVGSDLADREIVESLFLRSERGLAQLAARYGKSLLYQAERITGNHEDAEECVNDAYLAAWNSIPPNRPRYLYAYLSVIVRRKAMDLLDSRAAQKRRGVQMELREELADVLSKPYCPEQEYESARVHEELNCFLRRQPVRNRGIFVCRYWDSEPLAVLAEREGISEKAVKSLLARMRRSLKKQLEKEEIL